MFYTEEEGFKCGFGEVKDVGVPMFEYDILGIKHHVSSI